MLTIPENLDGQRLDFALSELSELSRTRIKQLLKEDAIHGPHDPLKPSLKVVSGESYSINMPDSKPLELIAENIPLDILFEDEYLTIINKPAGMVVHPSHGHDHGTLVHALLYHYPSLPGINGVERPGIVHRLDKETSGSLVVAKTEQAHRQLVELFSTHDIDRQYLAWSRGVPNWRQKRIELAIGRNPHQRQKMAVIATGKEAITDARIEKSYERVFSRIRLTLHTGRTHQIRVHLTHEQLPILGDTIYGRHFNPGNQIPEPVRSAIKTLNRQALHAEVLAFTHPITGEAVHCKAPLPDDLKNLSTALDQAYD
jgi:23S rRNA pseudouridine1911/1915/1917 synthase